MTIIYSINGLDMILVHYKYMKCMLSIVNVVLAEAVGGRKGGPTVCPACACCTPVPKRGCCGCCAIRLDQSQAPTTRP